MNDGEALPLLVGKWISAPEAFAWLAFGEKRMGWRWSKAIAEFQSAYGLAPPLAQAFETHACIRLVVRGYALAQRRRAEPDQSEVDRERYVDGVLCDLRKRKQI